MNKKILIWSSVVLLGILAIIFGVSLLGTPKVEDVVESTEPEPVETVEPSTQPDDVVIDEQDRELVFDNYVKVERKENDFAKDKFIAVEDLSEAHTASYEFSNGFAVTVSDNIQLDYTISNGVYLKGADGSTEIFVMEVDPTTVTVQELREEFLKSYGINQAYFESMDADIPFGAAFDIKTGILHPEDYLINSDGSVLGNESRGTHLLVDCIEKTAYGNALTEVIMIREGEIFVSHSAVLCDRDRILEVTITANDYEHLKDYLIELTNDCIIMIK